MVSKILKRIWRFFFPQYILYVKHGWDDRTIHVKSFRKKSAKRIAGVNINNEEFEIVSVEPMDYYIEEYRKDL